MRVLATGLFAMMLVTTAVAQKNVEVNGDWAGEISLAKDWQLLQLHVESAHGAIQGTLAWD